MRDFSFIDFYLRNQNKSHKWPSKSSNPQLTVNSFSSNSLTFLAPNSKALDARSLTISAESHSKESTISLALLSAMGLSTSWVNRSRLESMIFTFSLAIRQALCSFVNVGSSLNPSAVKKSIDFWTLETGIFTNNDENINSVYS